MCSTRTTHSHRLFKALFRQCESDSDNAGGVLILTQVIGCLGFCDYIQTGSLHCIRLLCHRATQTFCIQFWNALHLWRTAYHLTREFAHLVTKFKADRIYANCARKPALEWIWDTICDSVIVEHYGISKDILQSQSHNISLLNRFCCDSRQTVWMSLSQFRTKFQVTIAAAVLELARLLQRRPSAWKSPEQTDHTGKRRKLPLIAQLAEIPKCYSHRLRYTHKFLRAGMQVCGYSSSDGDLNFVLAFARCE